MGKGGLSFLNKKSWHTATIANAEKVWLAEQKDAAEKAKLAQLQKEIAEERQVEELRALQRQHGVGHKPVERLDWMYRSAEVEAEIKQKEQEEFLLGKPIPASKVAPEPAKPSGIDAVTSAGTERWVKKYEQRDLDAESRIREDPMLLILKQEQEQRLSILKNPLQMKRIREEVDKKKLLKKLKKLEKEEKKKLKKMEKKKQHSVDKADDRPKASPSRNPSPVPDAQRTEIDKYGLIQPRAPTVGDRRRHSSSDDRYRHRSRSVSSDLHHRRRSRERSRSPIAVKHQRRDSPDRSRRNSDERSDRRRARSPAYDSRRRSRSPSGESRRRPELNSDSKHADQHRLEALRSRIRNRQQRKRDVASSTASKLTTEEREARLKAMMSDAQNQHEIRSEQLALDIEVQKQEEEALRLRDSSAGHRAEFIQKLNKQAFMESKDTVEDRIKQRVHYRQKGSTEYHSFL